MSLFFVPSAPSLRFSLFSSSPGVASFLRFRSLSPYLDRPSLCPSLRFCDFFVSFPGFFPLLLAVLILSSFRAFLLTDVSFFSGFFLLLGGSPFPFSFVYHPIFLLFPSSVVSLSPHVPPSRHPSFPPSPTCLFSVVLSHGALFFSSAGGTRGVAFQVQEVPKGLLFKRRRSPRGSFSSVEGVLRVALGVDGRPLLRHFSPIGYISPKEGQSSWRSGRLFNNSRCFCQSGACWFMRATNRALWVGSRKCMSS